MKRLERDLSNRGIRPDDLPEYGEAQMCFELLGQDFPGWVHRIVAAEFRFGSSILEGCEWAFYCQMEDASWGRSAAIEASFREAELSLNIEHKKASTEGEIGSQHGSCVGCGA